MIELRPDIAIVGAGPAGLCAAIEAASTGANVLLLDENQRAGGQLFKQIHKFFGSQEHMAGVRGGEICSRLLEQLSHMQNVEFRLNTTAYGVFGGNSLAAFDSSHNYEIKAKKFILAAGGMENYISFPGSTLPGVMGAGAAQTMINVNHVLPGEKVVMLGSGNVGLIISYQLMQAGADVMALVEAAPKIGGYGVHAAKIARNGVPILTSHTIKRGIGEDYLEAVEIVQVNTQFQPIPGTEQIIQCDVLCLAVGLNPMNELAYMAGCALRYDGALGGHIPLHNEDMMTTNPYFYVAGDICGVEEASTAMEEGRLAGCAAAEALGFIAKKPAKARKQKIWSTLDSLRTGRFGLRRKNSKDQILLAYQEWSMNGGHTP